jgi:hypothetical protein
VPSEEWTGRSGSDEPIAPEIDVSTPSPARLYDYYLGGKDNFTADREAAEAILAVVPEGRRVAQENRAFLRRVVRYLTAEAGIRQFIDLGTGLPAQGNVHEIAQEVAPGTRVVYVDNDPIVLAHGEALLATDDNTVVIQADMRRPDAILSHPKLTSLIDFSQPVAVLFVSVLQFVPDDEEAAQIVRRFREAICAGSHLVISTITSTGQLEEKVRTISEAYEKSTAPAVLRTRTQVERLFGGLDLIAPGLVPAPRWHPGLGSGTGSGEGTSWVLAGACAIS